MYIYIYMYIHIYIYFFFFKHPLEARASRLSVTKRASEGVPQPPRPRALSTSGIDPFCRKAPSAGALTPWHDVQLRCLSDHDTACHIRLPCVLHQVSFHGLGLDCFERLLCTPALRAASVPSLRPLGSLPFHTSVQSSELSRPCNPQP